MEWPAYLDEYEKLVIRMTTPRVMIDNAGCSNATRVMIDSARKHGILLEAVQVLTDLNLTIKKAYISSDGRWFMDVFHVTDLSGNKLTDKSVISYIEQSLGTIHHTRSKSFDGLTALELTGTDRLGLLSEVFAVLADLECNVVEAKVWTHNGRIASLIHVKDCDSGSPIEDSQKIDKIEGRLRNVLKGDNDIRSAKTSVSMAVTHTERRLHQMMFADRDYERKPIIRTSSDCPLVTVQNCLERGYSVLNIQCKDRAKLLFDVVCTLTDMEYVVFHATIDTEGELAYLEFFIRHADGTPISSEPEKERVILCLQAAIRRRASEGVRLELCLRMAMGTHLGVLWLALLCMVSATMGAVPRKPVDVPFGRNYVPTWAFDHIKYFNGGSQIQLSLDKYTGTGFQSKGSYLFGHFSMQIKMVPGDSAGTVTAFYLSSQNSEHDEIDFEFLGNRTGQPYILQTNVFTGGKGDREQRIFLWFDPTKEYHSYSVLWNLFLIIFFVDDVPIRVFKNSKDLGVRFPFDQPMKIYSSLWNADDWATRGGLEKTDWSKAPFVASYRGFHVDGCEASVNAKFCDTQGKRWWDQKEFQDLDSFQYRRLRWVRSKYTIYNYCTDRKRYPIMPPECTRDRDV